MRSLLFFTLIFFIPNFLASPINPAATTSSSHKIPTDGPSDAGASTSDQDGIFYYPPMPEKIRGQDPTYARRIKDYTPKVGDVYETDHLPGIEIPPPPKGKLRKYWTLMIAHIDTSESATGGAIYECLLFNHMAEAELEGQMEYWEKSTELFLSYKKQTSRAGYKDKLPSGPPAQPYHVFNFKLFAMEQEQIDKAQLVWGIGNEAEIYRILGLMPAPNYDGVSLPNYDYDKVLKIIAEDNTVRGSAPSQPVNKLPLPKKKSGPLQKMKSFVKHLAKSRSKSSIGPGSQVGHAQLQSGGPSSAYTGGEPLQLVDSPLPIPM